MADFLILVVIWAVLLVVVGVVAANKGRSVVGWLFLAILLAPFVLLVLLALPKKAKAILRQEKEIEHKRLTSGEFRKCPFCAESVRVDAKVCRYCGRDLPILENSERFAGGYLSLTARVWGVLGAAAFVVACGLLATCVQGFRTEKDNDAQSLASNAKSTTAIRPDRPTALAQLYGVSDLSGNVKIAPDKLASIWFDQIFPTERGQTYVVFTKVRTLDENGHSPSCTACAPMIGAITYELESGGWRLASTQKEIIEYGEYGEAPKIDHGTPLSLSPGIMALLLESRVIRQGYTIGRYNIVAYSPGKWAYLGGVDISEDNAGTCDNFPKAREFGLGRCWSWKGTLSTAPGQNPQYLDLVVKRTGTTSGATKGEIVAATTAT